MGRIQRPQPVFGKGYFDRLTTAEIMVKGRTYKKTGLAESDLLDGLASAEYRR